MWTLNLLGAKPYPLFKSVPPTDAPPYSDSLYQIPVLCFNLETVTRNSSRYVPDHVIITLYPPRLALGEHILCI